MENRVAKAKPRCSNDYIKRLQKIVYQKQRQLQHINTNIQLEQTKADYERTIDRLQQLIDSQRKQLKQKDLQLFRITLGGNLTRRQLSPKPSILQSEKQPELLKELTENRVKFQQAKQDMVRLDEQMQAVRADLEAEYNRNQELAKEVERVRGENTRLQRELQEAKRGIEGKEGEYEQEKVRQLGIQILMLQNQLEAQKKSRLSCQSAFSSLKTTQKHQLQSLTQSHTAAIHSLKSSLTHKLTQQQQKSALLTHQLELLTMRFNVLENRYLDLEARRVQSLVGKEQYQAIQNAEVAKLREEFERVVREGTELKEELEAKRRRVWGLEKEIRELKEEEKYVKERERKAIEGQIRAMQSEKIAFQQNTIFRSKIQTLQTQNQFLKTQLVQKQKKIQMLNIQLQQAEFSHHQTRAKLKDKQQQADKLKLNIQEIKKQIISLMNEKDDIVKDRDTMRKDKKKIRAQTDNFKQCCKSEGWFDEITNQLPSFKSQFDKAQSIYECKLTLLDSILPWISLSLEQQPQINSICSLLSSIPSNLIPALPHLCCIITHFLRPSCCPLPQSQLPVTPQLATELSHLLNQTTPSNQPPSFDNSFNQQIFLQNLENQLTPNDSRVHHLNQSGDSSEMKQNFNMVKKVNEQLYGEITQKEREIKEMETKLRGLEEVGKRMEELKESLRRLMRQVKPSQKIWGYLANICTMLEINK